MKLKRILVEIYSAVGKIFTNLTSSDLDVMSSEFKEIMANPVDKKKYFEAVDKLRKKEVKEVPIHLSNGKKLILVN